MLGLETALALTLAELVEPGVLTLAAGARACCRGGPAAIAGPRRPRPPDRPGAAAQPLRVRPRACAGWSTPHRLASRARNTPFAGRTLTGTVRHTVLRGEPVVVDGEASDDAASR